MLNFRSLIAVAVITIVATMSIAQAAGQPGRKAVHQPKIVASESVRGGYAEIRTFTPDASGLGAHGLSALAGR